MNAQISFSAEDIKDNLSTPKFPKNQQVYLLEKEENTLDTLKQQIDKVYNDKDTLNNENINESKNDKNILINSLINSNINLELNNIYINQFSFDEKSSNFLSKKEENDNKENNENNNKDINIINENINENLNEKNNKEENNNTNNNQEEEKNDNEIKYINILTNEDMEKNDDSIFDYELPLDSDNTPEFFKMDDFPENNERKKEIDEKNSEKKLRIEGIPKSKKEKNSKEKIEKLNLTPQKKIKNKMDRITNCEQLKENRNEILKIKEKQKDKAYSVVKFNTSNKKSNKIFKLPKITHHKTILSQNYLIKPSIEFMRLLEENEEEQNNSLTERNNNKSNNLNTNNNSLKNTNFTSKDINNKKCDDKIKSNDNGLIKPFTIEQSSDNNKNNNLNNEENIYQKIKVNSNILKDNTISYQNKRNRRNRNSMNFIKRNNNFLNFNTEIDKTKIIYEKNLSNNDSRSFSISQKENESHSHSRNYKELNNNINNGTVASTNYLMNKRLKNCVILLSKNKNVNIFNECLNHDNSLKNFTLYENENFSQRSLDKNMAGKTERSSPFRKSKIRDSFILKTSSYKKYILNKDKLNDYNSNKNLINNTMKNGGTKNFEGYNIFENIEEIKKEKYVKEKINQSNIKNNAVISRNYINNTIFKNKGNLTQRNKDIGPANIYSKKIIFIPNANNNNETNNNNYTNRLKQYTLGYIPNKNKTLKKREINKSYLIPKEKNIKILNIEKNNNINEDKEKKKYKEYFHEILSNININKSITKTKSNLNNNNNNMKQKEQKEQKEKHKIRKIIQLSNLDINTMKNKTIEQTNKVKNKKFNSKFILNKINSNKIKNNNYIKNNKDNNTNNNYLFSLTKSSKNLLEKFKNNILNYSINRNNRINQVKNEVSLFIGDNNKKFKKIINEKKSLVNSINNNNNKINQLNKNKKTIINVNQYYSSYFIKK